MALATSVAAKQRARATCTAALRRVVVGFASLVDLNPTSSAAAWCEDSSALASVLLDGVSWRKAALRAAKTLGMTRSWSSNSASNPTGSVLKLARAAAARHCNSRRCSSRPCASLPAPRSSSSCGGVCSGSVAAGRPQAAAAPLALPGLPTSPCPPGGPWLGRAPGRSRMGRGPEAAGGPPDTRMVARRGTRPGSPPSSCRPLSQPARLRTAPSINARVSGPRASRRPRATSRPMPRKEDNTLWDAGCAARLPANPAAYSCTS
ncbi:hypothetical protein V8C86DRAFT_2617248 [Haematococcus lacustris]